MPKSTKGVLRIDQGQKVQSVEKTEDGFLKVTAPIARVGVYNYLLSDGTILRELVTEETLFNEESLASLELKPVTNNHPADFVNTDNHYFLSIGSVGQKNREVDSFLVSDFSVNDDTAIEAIEDGRDQLSPGYYCDVDYTPGITEDGIEYDAIQRNRRYNHLALVDFARGGDELTLRTDSADVPEGFAYQVNHTDSKQTEIDEEPINPERGGNMPQVNIDGVDFKVDDTVASHIAKLNRDAVDAATALDNEKSAHIETKAQKDAAEASVTALEEQLKPEAIQAKVDARVALIAKATSVLGEDEVKADASDMELMKAVVLKVSPDANMDSLDEKEAPTYVKARFDAAIEFHAKHGDEMDQGIQSQRESQATTDGTEAKVDAREKRNQRLANKHKGDN